MRLFYLALVFVFLPFAQPAHADCTLAGAAVCDGVACPGKTFKAGQIIYNADHGVQQVCLANDTWKALHKPSNPCVTSDAPGTACLDGQTVYAGSWNGSRYYTTTADQPGTAFYGTYTIELGANAQSITDGLLNTNTATAYFEANPQGGVCGTPYNPPACTNTHVLCKALRTTLGGDWYLPARDELKNVLYANSGAIGGFSTTSYWSSTEVTATNAYLVLFSNGNNINGGKSSPNRVRCVRRE